MSSGGSSPTGPLVGQKALVTGASRGIGLAVADELRAAGAHVVRLARSLTDGAADRQTDFQCDMAVPEQVDRTVQRMLKELGLPDIVVNNAGVFIIKHLEDLSAQDLQQTLAVNLTGPFLVARALVPLLRKRHSGHLVTIGSVSDYVALPGSAAYAASKYGVRGMHEVIRAELAQSGVRTTLISPGPVDTALWDDLDPDSKPGFTKRKDMMRAEDIAEAVLFAVTRPPRMNLTEMRMMPTVYTPRG